jgi:hypothetical protein
MNSRTLDAVTRQVAAMGCRRVRVAARLGAVLEAHVVTLSELVALLPALAARNAAGADVYIEPDPDEPNGLVLVDDIDGVDVEDMDAAGLPARVVVETSFKNLQAWLGFDRPLSGPERAAVGRFLAAAYGADPMCAASRHMGRLAGFTNRKPERAVNAVAPFALLRRARPKAPLLTVPEKALEDVTSPSAALARAFERKGAGGTIEDAVKLVTRFHARLAARHGKTFDASRADFAAVRVLAELGYDDQVIEAALVAGSPGLAERHPRTAEYCARTIARALAKRESGAV